MEAKLSLIYDREGDILHLSLCPPYPEQETEELGDQEPIEVSATAKLRTMGPQG